MRDRTISRAETKEELRAIKTDPRGADDRQIREEKRRGQRKG
jgi:hypothetical protein